MTAAAEMIRTYPAGLGGVDPDALMLRKCTRSDEDCADICHTTARVLSRRTGYDANITHAILQACATICRSCGDECASHASQHEHCRVCAEVCRRCEQACQELIKALG